MKSKIKAALFVLTAILTITSGSVHAASAKSSTPRTDGAISIWAG